MYMYSAVVNKALMVHLHVHVHIHVLHAMLEFPLFIRWLEIHVHALT